MGKPNRCRLMSLIWMQNGWESYLNTSGFSRDSFLSTFYIYFSVCRAHRVARVFLCLLSLCYTVIHFTG
jgi:hypothetical protein